MHRRLTLRRRHGNVPTYRGYELRYLGLGLLVITGSAWAGVNITTAVIGPHQLKIIEVTGIKKISQKVDAAAPYKSELVMEVTGQLEGHGEGSKIGLKLNRTDDGRPMTYMSFHAQFFGLEDITGPLGHGQGFTTAISSAEDFKVQLRVYPIGWNSRDESFEANYSFRYPVYQPVHHEVTRGFTAMLRKFNGTLKWNIHTY